MRTVYFLAMMVACVGCFGLVDEGVDLAEGLARGAAAQEAAQAIVPLEGLDPVMLVAGKEAQGDEKYSATRGRFRYLFASDENKAAFEREPARYEIQSGGTCARMGPTVRGNPDLYLVHDGRLLKREAAALTSSAAASPPD